MGKRREASATKHSASNRERCNNSGSTRAQKNLASACWSNCAYSDWGKRLVFFRRACGDGAIIRCCAKFILNRQQRAYCSGLHIQLLID